MAMTKTKRAVRVRLRRLLLQFRLSWDIRARSAASMQPRMQLFFFDHLRIDWRRPVRTPFSARATWGKTYQVSTEVAGRYPAPGRIRNETTGFLRDVSELSKVLIE
jgi:hypothetical protein